MIKIYCDKCGSLIEVEKSTPSWTIRHYSESGHDMCERCYGEYITAQTKFINDFFGKRVIRNDRDVVHTRSN